MKVTFGRQHFRWLMRILFVCWLIFVISNSMKTATESDAASSRVAALLYQLFHWDLRNIVIRKGAHLFEYLVFGVLGTLSMIPDQGKFGLRLPPVPLTLLFIALCDESVQLFWNGRSGEIRDVWIDFAGAVCGILLSLAGYHIVTWMYHRRRRLCNQINTPKNPSL